MLNSIENQKLVNLVKFEKYRYSIECLFKSKKLSNEDIISLLNVDINYGLDIDKAKTRKEII